MKSIQNALAERAFRLALALRVIPVSNAVFVEDEVVFLANTLMNASQTPE